jgi:hypothetical protein
MYIVSYGTRTGYYEQEFSSYEEAINFMDDVKYEVNDIQLEEVYGD